jgi:pimeloyl-ACP methyl ester carboxylesterase
MSGPSGIKMALPRPAKGESLLLFKQNAVINYYVSGDGETVVLLPAFARSASDYNELVTSLNAAGYRTVAIELRGMGHSKCPVFPRPSMHDFAGDVNDVVGVLSDLRGGKVHVLGRAFGARVARAFATNYPERVQAVILLAGGGRISLTKSGLLRYIIGNTGLLPESLRMRAVAATLYARGNIPPSHLAYRHTLYAMRRQFFALRTPMDEIWQEGTAPILWIHGEQDRLLPLANARALCNRFPNQVRLVVISNAGHALLPEQPDAVMKEITTFLGKHAL